MAFLFKIDQRLYNESAKDNTAPQNLGASVVNFAQREILGFLRRCGRVNSRDFSFDYKFEFLVPLLAVKCH